MVTVISKPIGHKLTEAELDATVSDSSSEALFTTLFAHGLVDGDYVYIQSNIESYNGFKYVDETAYNTFKIRDSENSAAVAYKQVADAVYKISVLQHGWQCVHLPIVYELESDLFPTNVDAEAYTPTTVVSQADENGYTLLNLSVGLEDSTVHAWIQILSGTPGVYQIVQSINPWQVVINLAYDAANTFGPVIRYYNNYCINVNVYAGIPTGHPWEAEQPIELAATLQFIPDADNKVKFSIAEILRGYIETRNNLTLDSLPNNIDFWTSFHIGYFESYDSSDGEEITTTETEETVDDFVGYAVNAKLPFKTESIGHLSDYINEDTYLAQWLTLQTQPLGIVGRFFDLSFLLIYAGIDVEITSNGVLLQTITNPGIGVIRVPLDFAAAGEYCIQAFNSIGVPMDNTEFANNPGADLDWTTGANPFVAIAGNVESDLLWAAYAFVPGETYTVIVAYNSSAVTLGHVIIVNITDNSFVTQFSNGIDVIATAGNAESSPVTFLATSSTTRIAIKIDGAAFSTATITINQVGVGEGTSAGAALTEEICVTVLEECDSTFIEDDNIRLTEDGDFRILE